MCRRQVSDSESQSCLPVFYKIFQVKRTSASLERFQVWNPPAVDTWVQRCWVIAAWARLLWFLAGGMATSYDALR